MTLWSYRPLMTSRVYVFPLQVLMEAGVKVNVEDTEGNTTLHVKCYGETGNLSELDCVDMLMASDADLTVRNNRVCSSGKFRKK